MDIVIRRALIGDGLFDLIVSGEYVAALVPFQENATYESAASVIDAQGLVLLPGLVDCHTHLREPGFEYKEDIASGLEAAAFGGFCRVLAMANTSPVNDNAAITRQMLARAREAWPRGPELMPVGALTRGLKGVELAPMAELAEAGCVAFSNDGLPVENAEIFRRALEYAASLGCRVIDHCEDPALAPGVGINEGRLSSLLGLKGQPTAAEAIQVARDILLAEYLNIPVHLAHISCRQSVELIDAAKRRGVPVTAETCPHYLVFTEDEVDGYNTLAKVNPPLRTNDDREAMRQALRQGVIDILATDHAPHADHEKEVEFDQAPNGITGLDTALSVTWGLVEQGVLDRDVLVRAWCARPAEIFGFEAGGLAPGDRADLILFDPAAAWTVGTDTLHSKGKNTPLLGRTLRGRVRANIVAGRRVI